MIYLQTYEIFEKKLSLKLRDPEYLMTKKEILNNLPNNMPDDLIKFILSWDKIKKSPYGQSWYSNIKSWNNFVDGAYRVADHWNFFARDGYHCRTIQDPRIIRDGMWHVGRYDKATRKYDIVKSYPKEPSKYYCQKTICK